MCNWRKSRAIELNGLIEEGDDTSTEKASDRTVFDAQVKREPITSSWRITQLVLFLKDL
jgi:hypothetical protein